VSSHTAHNQTKKAHRNGIKRPAAHRSLSLKGVRPMFTWAFCASTDDLNRLTPRYESGERRLACPYQLMPSQFRRNARHAHAGSVRVHCNLWRAF
jgi:hypothetical protein